MMHEDEDIRDMSLLEHFGWAIFDLVVALLTGVVVVAMLYIMSYAFIQWVR
jgi:hypothetical protein